MRYIDLAICFIVIVGCDSSSSNSSVIGKAVSPTTISATCENRYDSLLKTYADQFSATSIDLSQSLSPVLDSFLLSADASCLRKSPEYQRFIGIVLMKLALHHLKCCNQNYDLYQMEKGGATVIIGEFNRMAAFGQRPEMLNSGHIKSYVSDKPFLARDSTIRQLILAMDAEESRIKKSRGRVN